MKALALLIILIASPVWAQSINCSSVVAELKQSPPAGGNKARVELLRNIFLQECEARMGGPGAMFDAAEMLAIDKVLYPEIK